MNQSTRQLLTLQDGHPHPLLVELFKSSIQKYEKEERALVDFNKSFIQNDVSALLEGLQQYAKGNMNDAYQIIARQDTVVREVVPCVCWAQIAGFDSLLEKGRRSRLRELRILRQKLNLTSSK